MMIKLLNSQSLYDQLIDQVRSRSDTIEDRLIKKLQITTNLLVFETPEEATDTLLSAIFVLSDKERENLANAITRKKDD